MDTAGVAVRTQLVDLQAFAALYLLLAVVCRKPVAKKNETAVLQPTRRVANVTASGMRDLRRFQPHGTAPQPCVNAACQRPELRIYATAAADDNDARVRLKSLLELPDEAGAEWAERERVL